jgi:hypothetical protein
MEFITTFTQEYLYIEGPTLIITIEFISTRIQWTHETLINLVDQTNKPLQEDYN